jgi:hypothetical protein
VGNGWRRLFEKNERRSKFELARLMLQFFGPCYWREQGVSTEYLPAEVQDESCEKGSVAKKTWEFSSRVAAELYPPGCQFPKIFNVRNLSSTEGTEVGE